MGIKKNYAIRKMFDDLGGEPHEYRPSDYVDPFDTLPSWAYVLWLEADLATKDETIRELNKQVEFLKDKAQEEWDRYKKSEAENKQLRDALEEARDVSQEYEVEAVIDAALTAGKGE